MSHEPKSRAMSLLKTIGSTAVKASGEAIKRRILGDENADFESAAAARLAQGLDELKGAAMKIGQLLSITADDDFLPKGWKAALSKLQADATPKSWDFIEPLLHEAFPKGLPFAKVEQEAVHAASIAQVHRGWLKDGSTVAIKIRYPGLEKNVHKDLSGVKRLLKLTNLMQSSAKYEEIFKTVEKTLLQELNLLNELKYSTFYIEKLKNISGVRIANPYPELCSNSVFVTEWLEGTNLDQWMKEAEHHPHPAKMHEQRDALAERILEILFVEVFVLKTVQTDPNPANFIVMQDGTLAMVDFGATQELDDELVRRYAAVARAAIFGTTDDIVDTGIDLGFLRANDPDKVFESWQTLLQAIAEPFSKNEYSWAQCQLGKRVREKAFAYAMTTKFRAPPANLVFLNRRVMGTEMIIENLQASIHARELLAKYLLN